MSRGRGRTAGQDRPAAWPAGGGRRGRQEAQAQAASRTSAGSPAPRRAPPRARGNHLTDGRLCPAEGVRGEDVSEKLDIVPAEFFVHRHIYGKWACRCCERLVQEPALPSVIDGGIPAAGWVAHTLISRFVDHMSYYRQESTPARVRTRRARRWRSGRDRPVPGWSRCSRRTGTSCSAPVICTSTKRRRRCLTRAPARPSGPSCGATHEGRSIRRRAWSTTSASAAVRSTRLPSTAAIRNGRPGSAR